MNLASEASIFTLGQSKPMGLNSFLKLLKLGPSLTEISAGYRMKRCYQSPPFLSCPWSESRPSTPSVCTTLKARIKSSEHTEPSNTVISLHIRLPQRERSPGLLLYLPGAVSGFQTRFSLETRPGLRPYLWEGLRTPPEGRVVTAHTGCLCSTVGHDGWFPKAQSDQSLDFYTRSTYIYIFIYICTHTQLHTYLNIYIHIYIWFWFFSFIFFCFSFLPLSLLAFPFNLMA